MELAAAIELISNPKLHEGNSCVWADLGSGTGLFTYALAHLLTEGSVIYAIDKDAIALKQMPNPRNIIIEQRRLNFITEELNLPELDGLLLANSFHFVKNKTACIHQLSKKLRHNGSFLIVEYDTDTASWWVPYPISFRALQQFFSGLGYAQVNKLQEMPSIYGRRTIYAAYISRERTTYKL